MKKYLIPALLSAMAVPAFADDHMNDSNQLAKRMYLGGGVNHNVIDSPFSGQDADANGYTVFAGLEFANSVAGLMTSAELGYSDTGEFYDGPGDTDIDGIWVAAVAEKSLPEIDPRLSALARGGLDLGDDDGIFLGAGVGFKASEQVGLRAEFINKDASSVYQFSALFHF